MMASRHTAVAGARPAVIGRVDSCAALWRLAHLYGVMPAYLSADGQRVRAQPEALMCVMRALGADLDSVDGAPAALAAVRERDESRMIEPVTVVWDGQQARVDVRFFSKRSSDRIECQLQREDGSTKRWTQRLDDRSTAIELPTDLPFGYHMLEVEVDGRTAHSHVFVTPERCYEAAKKRKRWGVFLPVYALHSKRTRRWGIWDLTDLRHLSDWVHDSGGDFIGTLPLLATFLDRGHCEPGPYRPVSRLFWNELYIDVEASPEYDEEAKKIASARLFKAAMRDAARCSLVDFERIMELKRQVINVLAQRFFSRGGVRREQFEKAIACNPDWRSYAQFRAVAQRNCSPWQDWVMPTRSGVIRETDFDPRVEQYHLYAQWLVREQLDQLASRSLYLDLPVGGHPGGFDTWRFRESFLSRVSAGAPPDGFFTGGQNWGIAALHPQRSRENGHEYFRACIRENLRFCGAGKGMLRIDHVIMLHRLYCVAHRMEPTDGVYVRYPADELWAILCIESHRARVEIAGENLGTVPPAVNRTMQRRGAKPLYVGQFSWNGDHGKRPLYPPQPGSIASMSTHDTPTFAAFWRGLDIKERREQGLLDDEQAKQERAGRVRLRRSVRSWLAKRNTTSRRGSMPQDALLALLEELAASDAGAVLISLEDLWLETCPQNRPGISHEENWRRRAKYSLEHIQRLPLVREALHHVASATMKGGL